MSIAFLAWGSLVWDPRELPIAADGWQSCGPTLPVEFCRISDSRKGALTLVIDPVIGAGVTTLVAAAKPVELQAAVRALAAREGTQQIAYATAAGGRHSRHDAISRTVEEWLKRSSFEAAVWTDLSGNFQLKTGVRFSVTSAVKYLRGLPPDGAAEARRYISNAPPQIQTPVRLAAMKDAWFTADDL